MDNRIYAVVVVKSGEDLNTQSVLNWCASVCWCMDRGLSNYYTVKKSHLYVMWIQTASYIHLYTL